MSEREWGRECVGEGAEASRVAPRDAAVLGGVMQLPSSRAGPGLVLEVLLTHKGVFPFLRVPLLSSVTLLNPCTTE